MSLRNKSLLGFSALNVLMIIILFLDLANVTTLEWLATVLTILGIAITLSYTVYVHFKVIQPIKQLTEAAQGITTGKLDTVVIEVHDNGEISQLAQSFLDMKNQLRTMTQKIANSSTDLSTSIEELSASTSEITLAVEEVDQQIEKTSDGLKQAAQSASDSAHAMQETVDGIERITVATQDVFSHAKEANEIAGNGVAILHVAKNRCNLFHRLLTKQVDLCSNYRLKCQILNR